MAKGTLNLRIADYGVMITLSSNRIAPWLKDSFSGFASDRKPDLSIDILDRTLRYPGITGDFTLDLDISEQGNRVFFCTKSKPKIELGFFDYRLKNAVFFHYHDELSKQYLVSFVRVCFQLFLFSRGDFLVHACGIERNGRGYLFPAPSGYGKTTIARFSSQYNVLSDEFICLRKDGARYLMHTTPWREKAGEKAVLTKIFFPRKARAPAIKKVSPCSAANEMLSNIIYGFYNREIFQGVLASLAELSGRVPAYLMYFSLSPEFWKKITYDS
jgi:hypothetical protein